MLPGSARHRAVVGNVLGVLSLIFWALALVISLKYLAVVLRAEGPPLGAANYAGSSSRWAYSAPPSCTVTGPSRRRSRS